MKLHQLWLRPKLLTRRFQLISWLLILIRMCQVHHLDLLHVMSHCFCSPVLSMNESSQSLQNFTDPVVILLSWLAGGWKEGRWWLVVQQSVWLVPSLWAAPFLLFFSHKSSAETAWLSPAVSSDSLVLPESPLASKSPDWKESRLIYSVEDETDILDNLQKKFTVLEAP